MMRIILKYLDILLTSIHEDSDKWAFGSLFFCIGLFFVALLVKHALGLMPL